MMGDLEAKATPIWPLTVAAAIVILLWALNFLYGMSFDKKDEAGQFGDMFGAVNALFSGLAFSGVCYAIVLQRSEIKIARSEIQYTRKILEEQKDHLEKQNISIKKQLFENTFFKMLELLIDITDKIKVERFVTPLQKIELHGKDAFHEFLMRLKSKMSTKVCPFNEYYNDFYRENNAILGHYFRLLFNIMNFIDNSDIEDKIFYAKIVRAQLSDNEVAVLFYNGLSERGTRFKIFIERYGLLKNFNNLYLFDPELETQYNVTAFGARGAAQSRTS